MKKMIIMVASFLMAAGLVSLASAKIENPCIQKCDSEEKKCTASAKNKKEFKDCKKEAAACRKECKRPQKK